MSRTFKQEKTKGNLDRIQKIRKDRKLVRCLKADELFCELEFNRNINRLAHL